MLTAGLFNTHGPLYYIIEFGSAIYVLETQCLDSLCLPYQMTKPFALLGNETAKCLWRVHWNINGSQQNANNLLQHRLGPHPATVGMNPAKKLFVGHSFHRAPGKQLASHLGLFNIHAIFDKLGNFKGSAVSLRSLLSRPPLPPWLSTDTVANGSPYHGEFWVWWTPKAIVLRTKSCESHMVLLLAIYNWAAHMRSTHGTSFGPQDPPAPGWPLWDPPSAVKPSLRKTEVNTRSNLKLF